MGSSRSDYFHNITAKLLLFQCINICAVGVTVLVGEGLVPNMEQGSDTKMF